MNRVHKPQVRTDVVTLHTLELEPLCAGVPSFVSDGYVQSNVANGWHVLFRDPEVTDLTDHIYLVNQFTGQQFMLRTHKRNVEYNPFIRVVDELDMFDDNAGQIFECGEDSSLTIKWKRIDKPYTASITKTERHYYWYPDEDMFINVALLMDPLMDSIWHKEFQQTMTPPPLTERQRIWDIYQLAVARENTV